MIELLKTVPIWFLILAVVVLFSFTGLLTTLTVKSLSRSISKLDETLDRFQQLFDKLFERHDELDSRISRLEGKCDANHSGINYGRRATDK